MATAFICFSIFFFILAISFLIVAEFTASIMSIIMTLLMLWLSVDCNQDEHAKEKAVYRMTITNDYIVSPKDTIVTKTDTIYTAY